MPCPDLPLLQRWLAGGLDPVPAAELWRHVSGCPSCSGWVGSLQATIHAERLESSLPPQPAAQDLAKGASVGRYLVVEPVGRGAMGVVYAAYDSRLNRKVALKFLRVGPHDRARSRLLQEAQAMAAVRHPNVVSVFDVGTYEDQVFVVMEFVEGTRLGQWVKQQPRDWRTVLPKFLQAGAALHAIHLQGLVHRDFKPDNVLVGADGRVGVTDFGVARREPEPVDPLSPREEPPDALRAQPGALVGTPAYMSPEQLRGGGVDARSDQFSFCVALFEALYGQRPFEDRDWQSLQEAVRAGRLRELPSGARIPGALRSVLLRGLSTDPRDRYPSMRALLDALSLDPYRKGKWAAAAALSVVLVAGVSQFIVRRDQLCQGASAHWDEIWDAGVRARVEQAFLATRRPSAASAFQRVGAALDGFTQRWTTHREEACRATRIDRTQSEALMELRMACLDQGRRQVSELSRRLQHADGATLDAIVLALPELPALKTCADTERLTRRAAASNPRDREQEEAVRAALARAQPALMAGRPKEAEPPLTEALEGLRKLRSPALEAEAEYLLGRLRILQRDARGAEAALRRSALAAAAAREDEQEALAWVDLFHVVGARLERYDEAHALVQVAQAAIQRLEADAEPLKARLEFSLAAVLNRQGRHAEAIRRYQEALVLHRRAFGEHDPGLARLLSEQGVTLRNLGRYQEAEALHREAIATAERLLGDHPTTAQIIVNLAPALRAQGKLDEARAVLEQAASIEERTTGPASSTLNNLAVVTWSQGRLEEALALCRRSYALQQAIDDTTTNAYNLRANIGALLSELGQVSEGQEWFAQALTSARARFPPEHPVLVALLVGLSETHRQLGQPEQALAAGQEALDRVVQHRGKDHPLYKTAALALGKVHLAMGKPALGLPLLEAAVGPQAVAGDPDDADAREWLARGLVAAKRDRPRTRRLLGEALAQFDQGGPHGRLRAQRLRAWMRQQGLD